MRPLISHLIQLESIRSFLEMTLESCHQNLQMIERKNEEGMYDSFEDYEHDRSKYFVYSDIATRTVVYEITALVESELHDLAYNPWLQSTKHKGPKYLLDLERFDIESLSKVKMISDLPFGEILRLIEAHYEVTLSNIDGWREVMQARNTVNAFKHRSGLKHIREIDWTDDVPFRNPRHQVNLSQAHDVIRSTERFLRAIREATDQNHNHLEQIGDVV